MWLPRQRRLFLSGFEKDVELNDYKIVTLTAPGAELLPDSEAINKWNLNAVKYRKLLSSG